MLRDITAANGSEEGALFEEIAGETPSGQSTASAPEQTQKSGSTAIFRIGKRACGRILEILYS
ncbi:MAG: hypothetical protein U5N55_00090 [Cypionkella sp.]|nr:hypothetical protein [Cypionkella sp.]